MSGHPTCALCGAKAEYMISGSQTQNEILLCSNCAIQNEKGSGGINNENKTRLQEIPAAKGSVVEEKAERAKVCPSCGNKASDVNDSGIMGCAECYSVFKDEAAEMIFRLHGRKV